ncbi:hypothetical protein JSY36_10675 [Bacillus sp. H-16]|uniref:hypothetical protein n=1 Tax=Alteribacter salitolerans TaxID=2912333 RepID=UPI001966AC53|nr:hypothetical protein [Alteribacter salitolerans]MBM7096221.1 hypothetical protein [Alteribacter salitolerans]
MINRWMDTDHIMPVLITKGILLLIGVLFIPVVAVMYLQDLFFYEQTYWVLVRPREAYLLFGGGMLISAVLCFTLAISMSVADRRGKRNKLIIPHILAAVSTFPLFVFGISHYAYIDDFGIHESKPFSLSVTSFAFEDIEEVTRETVGNQHQRSLYTFKSGGEEISILNDVRDFRLRTGIARMLDENDWRVINLDE